MEGESVTSQLLVKICNAGRGSKIFKVNIQSTLFSWCFPIITVVVVVIFSYLFEKTIQKVKGL